MHCDAVQLLKYFPLHSIRLNYIHWTSVYLEDMQRLPQSAPSLYLIKATSLSKKSQVGDDQKLEQGSTIRIWPRKLKTAPSTISYTSESCFGFARSYLRNVPLTIWGNPQELLTVPDNSRNGILQLGAIMGSPGAIAPVLPANVDPCWSKAYICHRYTNVWNY